MGKNQHYIPRFALRNFTEDNNRQILTVYLMKEKRVITNASIKNQAAKDFIYGKDQVIESIFEKIENVTAITITKLMRNEVINDEEKEALRVYIHFQMNRTSFNAKNNNEIANLVFQTIYHKHPFIGKYIDKVKVELKNPYFLSFLLSIKTSGLLSDLAINIVNNNSKIPFVLGQRPVFIINPYLYEKKLDIWAQGIAVKGVCVLLPIAFNKLIIMYDRWCYSLAKKNGIIQINEDDITKINIFQFFYTTDCAYIKKDMNIEYLNMLMEKTKIFRESDILDIKIIKTQNQSMLYQQSKIPEINPNISFIKIKYQAYCEKIVPTKETLARTAIIPEIIRLENEEY